MYRVWRPCGKATPLLLRPKQQAETSCQGACLPASLLPVVVCVGWGFGCGMEQRISTSRILRSERFSIPGQQAGQPID